MCSFPTVGGSNPPRPLPVPWPFHAAELFGGAQLCVSDLDGDGDQDVLGSSAHAYGIAWTEQTADGWKIHMIDESDSQTHAIQLADMNGDGLLDFVTGKRYWAHNGHDPASTNLRSSAGTKWLARMVKSAGSST